MFPGQCTYTFNSIDNALVLSESLDEKAVQTLVDIGIADLFPENCDKWRTTNQGIHARYMQELAKRKDMIREEIITREHSLRHALREVVVEEVMATFPYVLLCGPEAVRCSRFT
jgi:hypothetical protein